MLSDIGDLGRFLIPMKFLYTRYISYLLLILALVLPFNFSIQLIPVDDYTITLYAPMWQYWESSLDYMGFMINPFGVIYIFWFWPSLLIVKFAYDAATKENASTFNYVVKVTGLTFFQFAFTFLLPFVNGYPPVTNVPLVFVGIIALLLARWTVPIRAEIWDTDGGNDEVF